MSSRLRAVIGLALLPSCAYTWSSGLPEHVRTVRVEVFENAAPYPGLEAEVARELVREFQAEGRLLPASGACDAVLTGRIARVRREPLQENALDVVVAGRVTVEAVVTLVQRGAPARHLLRDELVTSAGGSGAEGTWRARSGESEGSALAAAVRSLAREIVRKAVELW